MATPDQYAQWIVANEAKKGTREFNTVVQAYQDAKTLESKQLALQQGGSTSVMPNVTGQREILPMLKQSAIKGVAGLGDVVMGFPEDVKRLYNYATTPNTPVPQKSQPITEKLIANNTLVPQNEPNNPALKVADFVTQMVVSGGVNPYSVGKSLLTKTLPQAGLDIAKQFGRTGVLGTAGSTGSQAMESLNPENPFLHAAGAMIPMAALGSVNAMRGTPSSISAQAIKGVTPEQLKMADILLKRSYAEGAPLTGAEAIAQVTGQNPLQSVQRVVESSPKGSTVMSPFMAARPEGNAQYLSNTLQGISNVAPQSAIPRALQSTAENVVSGAENALSQKVSPYYKAAGTGYIPEADLATLTGNPKIAEAIKHVTSTATYGVKGADPQSVNTLVAAKHYLSDQFSKQSNAVTGAEKNAARVTTLADKELADFLKGFSSEYKKGSDIYAGAQRTQIEPLKTGGVGILAEQTGTPAELLVKQREQLMPANPVALFPEDIKRTVDLLRRKDPALVPAWTAQNLQGIFNETAQNLQSGANQAGGAKFITNITGNPQQRENLKTLITESAGPQAWQGFQNFADVMEAQGKRQGQGSLTASNMKMQKELEGGGIAGLATVPFKPSTIKGWYEDFRYGRNTDTLAKMLTDPDSVNLIRRLAKTDPNTAKAQVLVDTLVGGVIASKPEIKGKQ